MWWNRAPKRTEKEEIKNLKATNMHAWGPQKNYFLNDYFKYTQAYSCFDT